jgi:hypothetical protein
MHVRSRRDNTQFTRRLIQRVVHRPFTVSRDDQRINSSLLQTNNASAKRGGTATSRKFGRSDVIHLALYSVNLLGGKCWQLVSSRPVSKTSDHG